MFYSVFSLTTTIKSFNSLFPIIYLILTCLTIYKFIRVLHSYFYIPDKISSKFLNTTSKLNNKFNY